MTTPTKTLYQLNDQFLQDIRDRWFSQPQPRVSKAEFESAAAHWFLSTKINNIVGTEHFPYIDTILGCTHFIDSLLIKYGKNIQVLPGDYNYYNFMGIVPTAQGSLRENTPLIVSLPNWQYADIRPDWAAVLTECEQKNIDIHVDMAWIPVCRDIELDLSHPNIKSFAMSFSKYSMEWNRIGLRWSRQRTIDSITVFNHYQGYANEAAISCGHYILTNLPRDYAWERYGDQHFAVCEQHDLRPSKVIHVAHDDSGVVGIAGLLLG
jgi:hypothetical protein